MLDYPGQVHGRWVIHFTCGAMRALHLETDQDCSSSLLLWVCDPERNTQHYVFYLLDINISGLSMDTLFRRGVEGEFLTFSFDLHEDLFFIW